MATESVATRDEVPSWVLAFAPFLVIALVIGIAVSIVGVFDIGLPAPEGTVEILAVLTVIGFVAGILPVLVGMLWFPYFRRLDAEWVHAVLAFSAGILAFIAVEMVDGALGNAAAVSTPWLGESVALVAGFGTLLVMEAASRWRKRKTETDTNSLRIAYLVAIGLGLHSVGEGLAIGTAFVTDQQGLVLLLTLGFIIHNVTEGPAVIAALARERAAPPLRHFAVLGVLAGGGVIVGGWFGSLGEVPLLAAIFFAIAAGAIVQVTWEMVDLVQKDAGQLLTRRIIAAFVFGVLVIFFLEEVVVDGLLL